MLNGMKNNNDLDRHGFRLISAVPDLVHGVFGRRGGLSLAPYDSLNVGWSNGDSPEAVGENLARVQDSLGLNLLIGCRQVHGDAVQIIDEKALKSAAKCGPSLITAPADALITSLRDVGLIIKIADCQAVLLADPVSGVIANVHCGWRGSVNGVLLKVVRIMKERFGCRSGRLVAGISPSLGPCCAEFKNFRTELPPAFWGFQTKPSYFDFWSISHQQLLKAGLRRENIETAGRCTVCEAQHFFSYRGQGTTGRMAAVIALQ